MGVTELYKKIRVYMKDISDLDPLYKLYFVITTRSLPIHVAIDGNNLVYAIYYKILDQPWTKSLSYQYVSSLVANIFTFLKQNNIIVDLICFDMWSEKIYKMLFHRNRDYGDYCIWENDDFCEIDTSKQISLRYRNSGILWTIMRWIIHDCLYQAVGEDHIYMCGTDSDRYLLLSIYDFIGILHRSVFKETCMLFLVIPIIISSRSKELLFYLM